MHDALPYIADIRHVRVFWVQKGRETVYIDWGEMQYCVVTQQRIIQFSWNFVGWCIMALMIIAENERLNTRFQVAMRR